MGKTLSMTDNGLNKQPEQRVLQKIQLPMNEWRQ